MYMTHLPRNSPTPFGPLFPPFSLSRSPPTFSLLPSFRGFVANLLRVNIVCCFQLSFTPRGLLILVFFATSLGLRKLAPTASYTLGAFVVLGYPHANGDICSRWAFWVITDVGSTAGFEFSFDLLFGFVPSSGISFEFVSMYKRRRI